MTDINERFAFWYAQFAVYNPSWTMEDFKTNMNLLELNEWYPELDQSLSYQLDACKTTAKKHEWYEKFLVYNKDLTFENFTKKHELEQWTQSTDMKLEMLLVRAKANHAFHKTNEWLKKFQKFDPELTRIEFAKSHNIMSNTVWNDELETSIQLIYDIACDGERMQWYGIFSDMWPSLFEEKFLKLFDLETDMHMTYNNAINNPELFCKLMDVVYEHDLNCSYNLMIHKLDITAEHPCNEELEIKIENYFKNNV